jgi:hypothetical protein
MVELLSIMLSLTAVRLGCGASGVAMGLGLGDLDSGGVGLPGVAKSPWVGALNFGGLEPGRCQIESGRGVCE